MPVCGGRAGPNVKPSIDLLKRSSDSGVRRWPEVSRKHCCYTGSRLCKGGGVFQFVIPIIHSNVGNTLGVVPVDLDHIGARHRELFRCGIYSDKVPCSFCSVSPTDIDAIVQSAGPPSSASRHLDAHVVASHPCFKLHAFF